MKGAHVLTVVNQYIVLLVEKLALQLHEAHR